MELTENNVKEAGGMRCEDIKNTCSNGNECAQVSYFSKMSAIDIEFNDLKYSVPSHLKGTKFYFTI